MEISKRYVIYKLNRVLGSPEHLALEKIEFDGWVRNSFDTEKEAIQALIDNEKTFNDYVILKQIHLSDI